MSTAPIVDEDPTFDNWPALQAWEQNRVAIFSAYAPHAREPVNLMIATADRILRVRAAHAHLEQSQ